MSRQDREAFHRAIGDNPDDDLPRLVFADWLDEHGQSARAEFIRLQCEIARLPTNDPRLEDLYLREQQMLKEYDDEWTEEFRSLEEFGALDGYGTFERGFIADVTVGTRNGVREDIEEVFAITPLQRLTVSGLIGQKDIRQIAKVEELRQLQALILSEGGITNRELRPLLNSTSVVGVRSLDLSHNSLGDQGARLLASSKGLSAVEELNLRESRIGINGVRALIGSDQLQKLRLLDLTNNLDEPAIRDLVAVLRQTRGHLRIRLNGSD